MNSNQHGLIEALAHFLMLWESRTDSFKGTV